ncbi:MAG: prolyl oligopeptidase family serine peptidase, partial [Gelidibacter sp.]
MADQDVNFKNLEWSTTGEKLCIVYYLQNDDTYNLAYYDMIEDNIKYLISDKHSKKKDGLLISKDKVSLSNSGDKVFFYKEPEQIKNQEPVGVEIWNTNDPLIYSRKIIGSTNIDGLLLNVWEPELSKVTHLGTKELPQVVYNPNSEYSLNFNILSNEPQFHYYPYIDIYSLNMKTSEKELIVDKQYSAMNFVHFSYSGNYFAYFKDFNWWLYNLKEKKHTNLTKSLNISFYIEEQYNYNNPQPYGLAGWSKDEKEVFIYDKYDIWKISSDGTSKEKLTDGRNSNTFFRIEMGKNEEKIRYDYTEFETHEIDFENGILLSATNTKNLKSGYYQLKSDNNLNHILFEDCRLSNLFQVAPDSFIFQKQSLTVPPSIELINLDNKTKKTIFKSNPDWKNYSWPYKNLIYFDTEISDSLKGILVYPINYNPSKKYPMIVQVYEEQSSYYHRFTPPSLLSEIGFNFMNYVLDGYFVLLPDIHYEKGAPGISALICVEKAVEKVHEMAPVDKNKIGIIGHSFGGYETAFIITQTDLFAAAVAGAGVFNLLSLYLDTYKMSGHSEIGRVENGQFRMQESYFHNSEIYLNNSPLHYAEKINTPLLIWAGKNDANVNANQSIQGHLALR